MAKDSKLAPFYEQFPKISVEDLLELFRDLRQSTTSPSEQEENAHEIEPSVRLLAKMVEYLKGGQAQNVIDKFVLSTCSRVGIQFLGNTIVENDTNQKLLWTHSNLLKDIFCYDDTKVKNYICMVFYNIMLLNEEARESMLSDNDFMHMLLDEALLGLTEFPQFIVEKFIEFNYFDKLYTDERRSLHKIYILDLTVSLLKSIKKNFELDPKHVKSISEEFKREAEIILVCRQQKHDVPNGTPESESDKKDNVVESDPRLAVKLLSTLCTLTSDDEYNKIICDNTSLVIDTIYVLRALKMAEEAQKETGVESEEVSPALIGFKADLIRLVGNLCWKHRKNQDLVRENNCIQLILECCKLDEKNPFICEWAIMAIRNLTENNTENQEFIASLKRITETDVVAMAEQLKINEQNPNPPNS